MKIYTKTGDNGTTGLIGGDRISKSSLRIESVGSLDEANAALGMARALLLQPPTDPKTSILASTILDAQACLFDIGSEIAALPESTLKFELLRLDACSELELSMDLMTAELTPLSQFILPGGSLGAASLHIARSSVRKAERNLVALESTRTELIMYVNRLSDWLFVAARYFNHLQNQPDVVWVGKNRV